MALLHFRAKERRRTIRVALTVPVIVHGKTESGDNFCVVSRTQSVNQHGALLEFEQPVIAGQILHLVNDNTTRSGEAHVVEVQHSKEGKTFVGVEFSSPESNFWHMTFPIPGAKPLRRSVASKVITA